MGEPVEITDQSIFALAVDAIVNPANEFLAHAGGLAAAISKAAGPALAQQSLEIGFVATGQAVATTAGDLPFKAVIHTPGPRWRGGEHNEASLLASSHRSVIALAAELGFSSVAFPAISCGIFGYSPSLAAPVSVEATLGALAEFPTVQRAVFCIPEAHIRAVFSEALATLTF
jgi:O-acetyl-ADP-ribose deacetylase (regulator of RNase III)